jgi:hypothetical protein
VTGTLAIVHKVVFERGTSQISTDDFCEALLVSFVKPQTERLV